MFYIFTSGKEKFIVNIGHIQYVESGYDPAAGSILFMGDGILLHVDGSLDEIYKRLT